MHALAMVTLGSNPVLISSQVDWSKAAQTLDHIDSVELCLGVVLTSTESLTQLRP